MFDMHDIQNDPEIARYEVSRDGVLWRDYDPMRDETAPLLHKRIVFAPPQDERVSP